MPEFSHLVLHRIPQRHPTLCSLDPRWLHLSEKSRCMDTLGFSKNRNRVVVPILESRECVDITFGIDPTDVEDLQPQFEHRHGSKPRQLLLLSLRRLLLPAPQRETVTLMNNCSEKECQPGLKSCECNVRLMSWEKRRENCHVFKYNQGIPYVPVIYQNTG